MKGKAAEVSRAQQLCTMSQGMGRPSVDIGKPSKSGHAWHGWRSEPEGQHEEGRSGPEALGRI